MADLRTEEISLERVLNFRDIGDFINSLGGQDKPKLRSKRFYRSARPDEASEVDKETLADVVGIKTVIDLRSDTEHINAAKKHQQLSQLQETITTVAPGTAGNTVPKIQGVNYADINLNGKGFERALVWQLKYVSLARLIFNMALGYRVEGIAILGREIMLPRGLIGLGKDTLDYCGPEIKRVFDVLSNESAYPVLVHCTQGKDRTGLVVILSLLLCGIGLDGIAADYVKSEPELEPEKEERMKEILSIGLDESFAKCPPDFCSTIKTYLDTKYGGVEKYMVKIGVNHQQQEQIRQILLSTGL